MIEMTHCNNAFIYRWVGRTAVVDVAVDNGVGSSFDGGLLLLLSLAFNFPLASLFYHFLYVSVGTGRVIDQSEFQQGTKHKCQADACPNVYRLSNSSIKTWLSIICYGYLPAGYLCVRNGRQ